MRILLGSDTSKLVCATVWSLSCEAPDGQGQVGIGSHTLEDLSRKWMICSACFSTQLSTFLLVIIFETGSRCESLDGLTQSLLFLLG